MVGVEGRGDSMAFLASFGNRVQRSVRGIVEFFRGSIQELKKVRWPSRQEMISYTMVVLFTVITLTIFTFIIDFGISGLVNLILKK
jgi:preprotein translocase subunit SecE